jgi:hypothetical protein
VAPMEQHKSEGGQEMGVWMGMEGGANEDDDPTQREKSIIIKLKNQNKKQ